MRIRLPLTLLLLSAVLCSAEVVDRMMAVVNRQVILQSEVEQTARVEFLLNGKPLEQLNQDALKATLERLIDQDLLEQQIITATQLDASPAELAARLHEVRAQIPGATNDKTWQALLSAYGLTEQDVESQLDSQIRILRFVDLRFRGLVRVDRTAITVYYDETLAPELRKRGADVPPMDQVSDKIRQILVEQRIDGLLNTWLQTLRAQGHIERMMDSAPAAPAAAGAK
jgi:peptidyl-prolyl cis-trans isomerase SurA